MKLYEIDEAILNLVDEETGEILDWDAFDALKMEREAKVENVALWIKDLKAEAEAIKAEEQNLASRRRSAENKVESLKNYLAYALNGMKFTTPKVSISYRKSESVKVDEGFLEWAKKEADKFLNYKEPEVSKSAIKEAIKNGQNVPFATLEQKTSVIIK